MIVMHLDKQVYAKCAAVSFHFDRHPDLSALGNNNDIKKRMYTSY
jgi:hypothetical protein